MAVAATRSWPARSPRSVDAKARAAHGQEHAPSVHAGRSVQPDRSRARSRISTSSSRPTCRAPSRRSSSRWKSSPTTRCACARIHGGVGAITENDVMLASASTTRSSSASTSVRTRRPRDAAKRDEYRHPAVPRHLSGHRGYRKGHEGHARAGIPARTSSVTRRCATCSRSRAWAPSPALTSPTASSSATRRFACSATTWWFTRASSPRSSASRTTVKEVADGYECGVCLENYTDIKEGDVIECFVMEEIPR